MADDKSIWDLTVDILVDRQKDTRVELKKRFKKTRPFRTEPISDDELIQKYDAMTQEQWMELMTTHNPADVEEYKNTMENLKIKKMRGESYAYPIR